MRRPFLYLFLLLIFFATSCAEKSNKDKKTETANSTFSIPKKPDGAISDFAEIFTQDEVELLDAVLVLREAKDNEIAIISINLDSTIIKTDNDFDSYSLALFNKWEVGKKKKNKGVGILICPNLRRVRIEVGYGLESQLTNDEAKAIIDSIMIPAFKEADYYTGTLKGLAGIATEIK